MGTLTVNALNGQTVAAGASYVVPFPAGKSAGNYSTTGAKLTTGDGSVYPVTVSFGASGITVTNPTGRDIASGQFDFLDLQTSGILARFNSAGDTEVLIGPKNTEAELVSATIAPVTGGMNFSAAGQQFIFGARTSALRVATFGDSTANAGNTQNTPNTTQQDTTKVIAATWTSGLQSFSVTADKYLLELFYPQAYLVGNGGISGQTTTQMLARDQSAFATNRFGITDIVNLAPHVVLLRGGSINDFLGGSPLSVATSLAQHQAIIQRFLAANIPVIDCGIYGYTGAAGGALTLAQIQANIVKHNTASKAYAAQYPSLMRFIDWTGILSDGTGAYLSANISADGTHLTFSAQLLAAQQEALAIAQLFGPSSNIRYPGNNNVLNALFANTTTPGYGTVATGFTINATNCTRQNAKLENINGKLFQTVECVITAGTNQVQFVIPFDPSGTGAMAISSGDVWGFECDIYIAGLNGYAPRPGTNTAFNVDIRDTVGSGRIYVQRLTASSAYGAISSPVIGHLNFPPIQFDDVSANLTTVSNWSFVFATNDASGIYKVGIANPRIVKLNQTVVTI